MMAFSYNAFLTVEKVFFYFKRKGGWGVLISFLFIGYLHMFLKLQTLIIINPSIKGSYLNSLTFKNGNPCSIRDCSAVLFINIHIKNISFSLKN